jgi:peptidoglycan/xylan/chitin deacetylase (PgdA/CDA1 family)
VSARAVNLCFHGIGTPGRALEPDEARFWVDADRFEALLDAVAGDPGYRLTFDDGNASDAELALPALQRRGLRATFFVVAGRLDVSGSLGRDQVRELATAGMTIGTHGMRHRPWRGLRGDALDEELDGARALIAEAAGAPVEEAACPFGAYDRRVLAELRRRGLRRVYTVDGGPADPGSWLQSRHTILSTETPETIAAAADVGLARRMKGAVKRWR